LFAGRKLLVADDSSYYRTVISLTFSDEGIEVTTAVDSREALEKLEQSIPDAILASVSIPGTGGYELCQLIKQSERFGHIPVMLLVGLHEPFDQAEARRAGADDVVTKPFKSIRQLVNRVGSMLGGKGVDAEVTGHEYSTLGLGVAGADQPADVDRPVMPESNVTVFVEAASMTEPEAVEPEVEAAGSTCVADVELQTADTQKLEPIDVKPAAETIKPIAYAQDDTIEMEPASESGEMFRSLPDAGFNEESLPSIGVPEMNEKPSFQTVPLKNQAIFQDALLDLGEFDRPTTAAVSDDLILDLDYEEPGSVESLSVEPDIASEIVPETVPAVEAAWPVESFVSEPVYEEPPVVVADLQEWAIVAQAPAAEIPAAEAMPAAAVEEQAPAAPNVGLSPEEIDAIARRVVEQMSDAVVREIAWEVVPELAELLIKKKLDEQK
jgi:CheY-like chemotaxis protein